MLRATGAVAERYVLQIRPFKHASTVHWDRGIHAPFARIIGHFPAGIVQSDGMVLASGPFMTTVADVLIAKGSAVHTVAGTASVYDAIDKMVRYNIGALVVVDAGNLQGIVTERDYLQRVALAGRTSKTTMVHEIMSVSTATVGTSATVEECMQLMTRLRVRHLPVLTLNRIVGLVSIGDVVKSLLNEQAGHIQNLTEYIQGRA